MIDNFYSKLNQLKLILPQDKPIGMTSETKKKIYFYDTVTGKILECNEAERLVLDYILSANIEKIPDLYSLYSSALVCAIDNIITAIQQEQILSISHFKGMAIPDDYEYMIQNELNQMIIELTEQCNLRCGYCIYNEECEKNRDFGSRDITESIAFKAIDYANIHSKNTDTLHITFYGGEPLIKYDLMKKCIRYSRSKIKNKNLFFGFTTNGILLTQKMAQEIAQENIHITVSIDGPQDVHDLYRRDIKGNGSFARSIKGLRNIVEALGEKAKERVLLSMVYAPPYSIGKMEQIQDFFN